MQCVISGFRRGVNDVFTVEEDSSWTACPLKKRPIGFTETSVTTNQHCLTFLTSEELKIAHHFTTAKLFQHLLQTQ
jgi:hypothetical protein